MSTREAEPEAGGRGGASAATIGARDRDALASRGDHATGRGDRESAASAPSLLASSRSLSSPSIAISTGSVTSILLSIQILSFLRRFVSASFSNDSSIGDVFFFQPGRRATRFCSNAATNRFTAAIERTPPLPRSFARTRNDFVEKNTRYRRSLFPITRIVQSPNNIYLTVSK